MKQYIVQIAEYQDLSGRHKDAYYLGFTGDHVWPIATDRDNAKVFDEYHLHDMAAAIYDYSRAQMASATGITFFDRTRRPRADRILVLLVKADEGSHE